MARHGVEDIELAMREFTRGVIGGISDRGIARPNWLSRADNLYGRPYRAMRVRPGSRDLSSGILSDEPHSLMAFYAVSGNKLFVAAANTIHEVTPTGYPVQSLPASHLASSDILTHCNLNGILVATQRGGALTPLSYDGVWKELKLPKPGSAPTFAADSAGGSVDAGTHYYRYRWRHANGSSLVSPVSAARVVANPNFTVNLVGLAPGSPRSDYIGFTVERTKINGDANGPFFLVADGTGNTYADTKSDASLGGQAREGNHGEPPHFDGVTSFANRLVGWAGSTLYVSNAIGDLEASGIANFHPDADSGLIQNVAKDDGDTIQVCVVVLDQLLILKRHSVHVLSGVDPQSFVLTSVVYADPARGSEAGCATTRAACVIGGKAYFWGESGGLFTYASGTVSPVAWVEMGQYLEELNASALDQIVLVNHQGNYMLAWYPPASEPHSEEQLVFDARYRQWWHWRGWRARDAIELKSGLFSNATLAICDPLNRTALPALTLGDEVTGPGIQGNTILSGVSSPAASALLLSGGPPSTFPAPPTATKVAASQPAGATSFQLSQAATATAQDVTLRVGGVDIPHANTVSGSTTVTVSEYHCWDVFDAVMDEKGPTGTGGVPIRMSFQTPWLDGGDPKAWKEIERLALTADGDQVGLSVTVASDPAGGEASLQLQAAGSGASWASDDATTVSDLIWDEGLWSSDSPTEAATGLSAIGKRFRVTVAADVSGEFQPTGLELSAKLLPDQEYDR